MEINTAKVDLKEFTFGILSGYIESTFDDNGKFIIKNEKSKLQEKNKLN